MLSADAPLCSPVVGGLLSNALLPLLSASTFDLLKNRKPKKLFGILRAFLFFLGLPQSVSLPTTELIVDFYLKSDTNVQKKQII